MIYTDVVFGVFIVVILLGAFLTRKKEKNIFNNGICNKCSGRWEFFDIDSSGARGYKCSCGKYIWISYNVDKRGRG
jgi:hypothetical protein